MGTAHLVRESGRHGEQLPQCDRPLVRGHLSGISGSSSGRVGGEYLGCGLAVRTRRLLSGAAGEPTRNPGGHQLRQRAQLRTRPVHRDAHAPHGATGALVRGGVREHADVPRRYGVEDVLRAATVGGAINAGRQDEVGTIEVGKRADLVLIALDEVTTSCADPTARPSSTTGCRGRRHGIHRQQGEEVGRRARRGRLRPARPRG